MQCRPSPAKPARKSSAASRPVQPPYGRQQPHQIATNKRLNLLSIHLAYSMHLPGLEPPHPKIRSPLNPDARYRMRVIAISFIAILALSGCHQKRQVDSRAQTAQTIPTSRATQAIEAAEQNFGGGEAISPTGTGTSSTPTQGTGAMAGSAPTSTIANNLRVLDQEIATRYQEIADAQAAGARYIANAQQASANYWNASYAQGVALIEQARAQAVAYYNSVVASTQSTLQWAAAYNAGVNHINSVTAAVTASLGQVWTNLVAYVNGATNEATTYVANVTTAKTAEIQVLQTARAQVAASCWIGLVNDPWVHCQKLSETAAGTEFLLGLRVGNGVRYLIAYVPAGLRLPAPVVIDMHGAGGQALTHRTVGNFQSWANGGNFLLITPQGTDGWNAGTCCGSATNNNVDDVGFIRTLVDSLPNINRGRVYAVGLSNGGMMAQRLACELSDRITAVSTVTGPNGQLHPDGRQFYTCNPRRAVPILMVYGTNDTCVPFNGGLGICGVPFISVRQNYGFWSEKNHCGDWSANIVATQGPAALYANPSCARNAEVSALVVYGGVHDWQSQHVDTTRTIVEFFARHSM